jgi:myosin-1
MPEIRRYIIQTCGAVKYLHHRNIIHRDLKTGNLFLDKAMNVKVGDFGLAAMLVSKNDIGARRTTMCGTPNYLAPEILEKGGRGHNEKVDLWAIGIIAYTLAVGKAPFHAAKREDIYKKLQNCDYEWPDISKNQNDISNDLRHLVSSLLVPEDDRPGPDQIVSHSFFKMAFIPDHLDSSCTMKKPNWTVPLPTEEIIQRGYSESWMKLCRASGVGEYAPGRMFPLTNAKRITSVVRDVEKEIAAGRAPIVPIPKDTVYLPYPERTSVLGPRVNELSEIAEEQESSSDGPRLSETSGNARILKTQKNIAERSLRIERLKENVDPLQVVDRPKPVAEMTRKKNCRKEREGDGLLPEAAPIDRAKAPAEVEKPIRSRQASRQAIPEVRSVQPVQVSRETVVGTVTSSRHRSWEQATDQPALTRQASRRCKATRVDSVILPKPIVQEKPVERARTASRRGRITSRVPSIETQTIKDDTVKKPQQNIIVISSDESTPPSSSSDPSLVPLTDPGSVLARVSQLRDNIASVLEGRSNGSKRSLKCPKLPFVTKWVDYSRKLGVGYVLDDGSIGCIMTSTSRHPVTNVVVRNGFSYLQDSKKDLDTIGQIPLEYYECQDDGLKQIAVGAERKRSTGIVWAKFGRYMCQQLGQAERQASSKASPSQMSPFVRFYERLGMVGIWGFSDGCFQVSQGYNSRRIV